MQRNVVTIVGCLGLLTALLTGCSSGTSDGGGSSSTLGGATGASSISGTSGGASSGGASGGMTSGGAASAGTTSGGSGGGDTWSNWASPNFFQLYCIGCHTPGGEGDPSGGLDFSTYQDVSTNAALIRCGVAVSQDPSWNCGQDSIVAEQFPIGDGAKPTSTERTRLVAWIDAGLPE
jgi:hypothetical protein